MKNLIIITSLLLAAALLTSGCTDQETGPRADLLTVNSTNEIETLLENGPVFIDIGADRCPSCVEQKPIVEELAAEYGGQVAFVYINTDKQPQLSNYFNVYYIPDMTMIVSSDNGKFTYLTRWGTLTNDRQEAMIFGLTPKSVLEVTIQDALRLRGTNT
ncbi:MAG: thioredoxin family protein [ANME-2 cluster archaeon]|jgi:thioredoxin 1|nr:thioredoxin family protein [ANME-2 cluster archaeon]